MKVMNLICDMQDGGLTMDALRRLKDKGFDADVWQKRTSEIDSDERAFSETVDNLMDCSLAIVRMHAGLTYFKKFDRFKAELMRTGVPLIVMSGLPEDVSENRNLFDGDDDQYLTIRSYLELGGPSNEYNLLAWLMRELDGADADVSEPERVPAQGLYEPGTGMVDSVPVRDVNIAVMFAQNDYVNGDTAHVDALINEIRSRGYGAIPVFLTSNPSRITGSIGIDETIRRYFCNGGYRVSSAVLAMPFSQLCLSDPGDGSERVEGNIFDELGVPVIQATSMFSSRDDWLSDVNGLGPYELSMDVFWPEYDGQIITVPLSSTEKTGDGRSVHAPIDDRVEAIADLAINWAVLKNTPVGDRRIAILLHQNPPRMDMIGGAFGLDAAESTSRLIRLMKRNGYSTGNAPSTGKGLTDRLLKGVSNDTEWLSAEDMLELCADRVALKQYKGWLSSIDSECSGKMCRDWGGAPGEINTVDGITVIPGFTEGNLFIGLQPNRGMANGSADIYHSQDLSPPHSYLAFYRWMSEVFGAHAVLHMGCHGTLEWLPGKGTGLSSRCFPDVVFGHLPHIYPYAMSNPGEGMHAKRRNGAVIVDHLIPPMTRSGGYDELLDVEARLQEYLRARSAGLTGKTCAIADDILTESRRLHLLNDIGLDDGIPLSEFEKSIDILYDYICEVKDNLIKNGLHILGEAPSDERLDDFIYTMVRTDGRGLPSLRSSIGKARGYDIGILAQSPSAMDASGMTCGEVIDRIDGECMDLIRRMHGSGFDPDGNASLSSELFGTDEVQPAIDAICSDYVPKLMQTSEELDAIMDAFDGRYVLPGPSGCISRGNPHLLPSGRNFYSIDPASIPTRSAWSTGSAMAEQMISRYVSENGGYPRQVGIVIWATDTMKTGGDDIAYVLHLLGVRPVWSSNGGAVTGLEIETASDLGRPRIDVTLRISGLFRDSFPNLVELIDDAVKRISELDESEEDNYLIAHLRRDIADSIAGGMDPMIAGRKARVRIFGDPPGNYGGGVDALIASSGWDDAGDLADAYVEWGGYAYGGGFSGEDMKDFFRRRMSEVDVTVKNHESRELDAFDNDDDYVFLGGMNATVESCKGEKPFSVMGDSSDPSNTRLRTLAEEGRFIYRSRALNPKWLDGLKRHGYRGVQEITNLVEFSFGWDSTSGIMEDWMYEAVTDRFVFNEENREWIRESNPDALRQITSRLLEAVERGMWNADDDTVEALRSIFLDSESMLESLNDH